MTKHPDLRSFRGLASLRSLQELVPLKEYDLVLVVVLALAPLFIPPLGGALGGQMTTLFIYAVLALALNMMVGFAGMLHLGIIAFFAIGSYTMAILTVPMLPFGWPFAVALIASALVAAAFGMLLASPTVRLRGDYLALVTLGFGEVTKVTLRNLEGITGGMKGLGPVPPPGTGFVIAGIDLGRCFAIDSRWFYFLALGVLATAIVGVRWLVGSRLGRAMEAVREDELGAMAAGIPVARIRLAAFAISSALAGLAGGLYAASLSTTGDPSAYDFNRSVLVLSAVILGGLGSIPGTIAGVAILVGFDTVLSPWADVWLQRTGINSHGSSLLSFSGWRMAIFGMVLIIMMRFRPAGLVPSLRYRMAFHPHETHGDGRR